MTSIIDILPIRDDQVDLWLLFTDEVNDEALLTKYRVLLTNDERMQEKRFYFAKDQHRYLLTRALVRTLLSRYVPQILPEDWRFTQNAYGRPVIANDNKFARTLSFNISHTSGLIVLAVTRDCALGVDVENLQRQQLSLGIADRFFAPTEVAALKALDLHAQPQRFFEYWTLKESYIKARGMGLSIPLDKFNFRFPSPEDVSIAVDAELNDTDRWHFWQLQLTADHLAAVCVLASGAHRALQLKKIVPLANEMNFDATTLRETK